MVHLSLVASAVVAVVVAWAHVWWQTWRHYWRRTLDTQHGANWKDELNCIFTASPRPRPLLRAPLSRNSECQETIEWSEFYHLFLLQGKLYAYQVINSFVYCSFWLIVMYLMKKAGPSKGLFCVQRCSSFLHVWKIVLEFWDHTLSGPFLIMMKSCFINIIIAQRDCTVPKLNNWDMKKGSVSTHTRKNF
jgi:hypothetical protein